MIKEDIDNAVLQNTERLIKVIKIHTEQMTTLFKELIDAIKPKDEAKGGK